VQVPKLQASGKLIAVIRSVNKSDQTLHLRAEITQGAEKLSPGQFVEAEISLGVNRSTLACQNPHLPGRAQRLWCSFKLKVASSCEGQCDFRAGR